MIITVRAFDFMFLANYDFYVNGVFVLGLIMLLDGNVVLTGHHDLAQI